MTRHLLLVSALLALTGCVTAAPPVEVTRFHAPALASLTPGTAYRFAAGADGGEIATYRVAVANEMQRLGFVPAAADAPAPLLVRVEFSRKERLAQGQSPVSIGVGGGTGSYGSGVGVGIGLNLSGGPRRWTDLVLAVRIDAAASATALWEGRAVTAIPVKAPAAQPSLAAAKLTSALFRGFPGESGQTISVP